MTPASLSNVSTCTLDTDERFYIIPSVLGQINVGDYLYELNNSPYTRFQGISNNYYGIHYDGDSVRKTISVNSFGKILTIANCD